MQNEKKKHNVTPDRIRAKKEFSHLTEDEELEYDPLDGATCRNCVKAFAFEDEQD